MKRALVVCVLLAVLGVAGWSQFTLSGSWKTTLDILPSVGLNSMTLTLNTTFAGFTLSSVSSFNPLYNGFYKQGFTLSGALGPFTVSGAMYFDPVAVAYLRAYLAGTLDFAGLKINAGFYHGKGWGYTDLGMPAWYGPNWMCAYYGIGCHCVNEPGLSSFITSAQDDVHESTFVLTTKVENIYLGLSFFDSHQEIVYSDGTQTKSLTVNGFQFGKFIFQATNIELCCGLTYDFELQFDKSGFQKAKFGINNLFDICCGLTGDLCVTFGVDYKSVDVIWNWGVVGTCATVYIGNPTGFSIDELDIAGWEISCSLGDCSKVLFGTAILEKDTTYNVLYKLEYPNGTKALTLYKTGYDGYVSSSGVKYTKLFVLDNAYTYDARMNLALGWGIAKVGTPDWTGEPTYTGSTSELPSGADYVAWWDKEGIEATFCGAGCCGGQYTGKLGVYWGDFYAVNSSNGDLTSITPTLFGLSKVTFSLDVPVMTNLSFNFKFSYPLVSTAISLQIGWTFSF